MQFKQLLLTPLLHNRNFMLLYISQLISLVGSGLTTIGLALFAHQLVQGNSAAIVIGNALMLRILAFLLFSQFAGILADRLSRKKILIAADIIRLGLLGLFPWIENIWQIYVMIFLINAVTAFFTPTFHATIPEVAGRTHYVKALSLSRIAINLEALVSPVLAGLVFTLLGLNWLFWLDSLSYMISATLVFVTSLSCKHKVAIKFALSSLTKEISYGTKTLFRHISLKRALLFSFAEATAGASAIVASVVYIKDVLLLEEASFAFVMGSLGLGSAIAALILSKITGLYESSASNYKKLHELRHRWTDRALPLGGIILGLLLIPGFLQPNLILFAILWFFNGVGQSMIAISSTTLLAEHTSETERGKVYAAHFAWTHAFWLVTYPAIGYGVAAIGVPWTFTVAGVVCLFITGLSLKYKSQPGNID